MVILKICNVQVLNDPNAKWSKINRNVYFYFYWKSSLTSFTIHSSLFLHELNNSYFHCVSWYCIALNQLTSIESFVMVESLFLIHLLALQLINHRVKGDAELSTLGQKKEQERTRSSVPPRVCSMMAIKLKWDLTRTIDRRLISIATIGRFISGCDRRDSSSVHGIGTNLTPTLLNKLINLPVNNVYLETIFSHDPVKDERNSFYSTIGY